MWVMIETEQKLEKRQIFTIRRQSEEYTNNKY